MMEVVNREIRHGLLWLMWMFSVIVGVYGQSDSVFTLKRDWLVGQREQLPGWLVGSFEEGRIIGVSDPGLRPEIALEQALMRASFLYALQEGVKVSVVTDYFSYSRKSYEYELTHDKLISMIRVEAPWPTITWRIGREWETQYGEIAVEVFPDSISQVSNGGEIFGELMLVNSGDILERNELRCEWKFNTSCGGRIQKSEYQLKGRECSLQIRRVINDTVLALPVEGYWYADVGEPWETEGYRMNRSFWCAQMHSLLYALAGHIYPEVKMKNLDEGHYEAGRGLKREVMQCRVKVYLQNACIRDNKLLVEWKTASLYSE